MAYELSQLEEAYKKLKSYIYYDNTDILLRKKLVEFETNTTKDAFSSFHRSVPNVYGQKSSIFKKSKPFTIEEKLAKITEGINNYHTNPTFFNYFLSQINVHFYPKKIFQLKREENFITNNRIQKDYKIERITAFIDAPIEIHILSVLWIIEHGKNFDAGLGDCCFGNRLILNKNKDNIVQGSSLFKPYYSQYQKWRDESVTVAQSILEKGKDVLFLNLDIQDYFHSVRIPHDVIHDESKSPHHLLQDTYNLKNIFLQIHIIYTKMVGKDFELPYNFYDSLNTNKSNKPNEVILPIGLLSSYILANYYLKEFDIRVQKKIKPAYYGRYVDDILLVIADPNQQYDEIEKNEEFRFSFKKYRTDINKKKVKNEKISFEEKDLNELESFVLKNIYPVIKLVDKPAFLPSSEHDCQKNNRIFKLAGYDSLYCQSSKSLVYYFEHTESDLVIDKLKKELNERTSEFRDFPEEGEDDDTFEESAYHLLYDGTEGKIKTLKDYKENRYGLTIYLANKIFSALRHENVVSDSEKDQVLRFFRGLNCLDFYRLWEKIFTFFLVNNQPKAYVAFYLHCLEEIEKIDAILNSTKIDVSLLKETMIEYLDTAHEIALSLNPTFIKKTPEIARHFEFQISKFEAKFPLFFKLSFEFTKPGSFWLTRFRATNMIRQHYIIHPLLTFTKKSKKSFLNLTCIDIPINDYHLDEELLNNSPRPVKFWECCLVIAIYEISQFKLDVENSKTHIETDILSLKKAVKIEEEIEQDTFYLEDAFELYKKINKPHIPHYILEDKNFKAQFFTRNVDPVLYDKISPIKIQEINVNSKNFLSDVKIAFCNTTVEESNIVASIRDTSNLGIDRYLKLASILKKARSEKSHILLFPEFFTPISLLSSIVRYSEKNNCLTISGIEHIVVKKTALNFITTILPVEVNGIKDAVVVFRLKNHYSHSEEELIDGNHCNIPALSEYRYDIFNWRNIYFSPFYCFELANSFHRSLMKGKIDLLIGIEWNKDTPYFSNIVETTTRDLHAFVAQVNTSQYGDTRLTQPCETARKDIIKLKGGINDAILVAPLSIGELREFQRKKYSITHHLNEFKPLPPDFSLSDILKRINNQSIL